MNSKKTKRNKEESLLISYNSAEDRGAVVRSSESDDNVPPLDLPPTRLRRPRSRKLHVAQQSRSCCSLWNALQMIFVLFTIGTMISMMWFTVILKTSLESMKKRVTSLESFDRSTSREYENLNNDLTQKYKSLEANKEKAVKDGDEKYKSILKQIAYLNSTIDDLQKRVKLPESANKLTSDIESLKKGMADTGGDITEIKDKIKQLTDLAGKHQGKMDELSKKVFNLTVQVAQVMGKPTPKAPTNTGTPPLILRMPISADENQNTEDKSVMKNITAQISVEVARVMGIVTSVNHTLSYEVARLRVLMKSLLTEVKKHVVTIDELQTEVSQILRPNHSSVVSRGHLEDDSEGVSDHVFNLTVVVTKLSDDVEQHSRNLAELMLEVLQINTTVYHHQHHDAMPDKYVPCNCSSEVGKLWEQLSSNKLSIESVQQELQALQKPVEILPKNNTSALDITEASISEDKKTPENQSSADSIAAQTDKDIEQDELNAENIKPSPSPESNASDSVLKVDKITEPSVLPSGDVNSTQHPAQPLNTTASPQVTVINSTENNQTLSTDHEVRLKVIKLSTPSAEEKLEHNLEDPDSES